MLRLALVVALAAADDDATTTFDERMLAASTAADTANEDASAGQIWAHVMRPAPDPAGCGGSSGVSCPVCPAFERDCNAQRVRRNWATLTDEEKQKVIDAMHRMKWTTLTDGQAMYGSKFLNWDYFVHWHSTFENDPRGDQGHLGQHFVLVHKAFVLAFENALLAVDPSIGALPYWDLRTDKSFLGSSSLQFGSSTGTGADYSVADGAFANWTVGPVDSDLLLAKTGSATYFKGNNFTGTTLLRNSNVPTTSLVRFPKCADIGPNAYTADDYSTCANQTSWVEWYWCAESGATHALHEFPHFWVGSAAGVYGFPCASFGPPNFADPAVLQGDYIDKSTSTNDPIFFLHHAFVDMNHVEFQLQHPEGADTFWGYQATGGLEGTHLMEVLNSVWPFKGSDLFDEDMTAAADTASLGDMTASAITCWLGPHAAPYTYDDLKDKYCAEEDAEDVSSAALATTSAIVGIAVASACI
jgi:hypothetical protein